MKYLVTHFTIYPNTEVNRDLISDAACEAGYESFEETESGVDAYIRRENYNEELLNDCVNNAFFTDVRCTYKTEDVEDENWNRTWEENGWEPIIVADKCIIFDKYHIPSPNHQYPLAIQINSKQAFGTGTHETTYMIVNYLLAADLRNKKVLDCGCGTGILSIIAAKQGAENVVAYDIDEWSVRNSIENMELNNTTNIEVVEGDSSIIKHLKDEFDLVVANINRNILLADMSTFANVLKKGGNLLLSGFYENDNDIIIEKAKSENLVLSATKTRNQWSMIEFVKM